MTIERELSDAEQAVLSEAASAANAFTEAFSRLGLAFQAVVEFNLRERSRLESELASDDSSD